MFKRVEDTVFNLFYGKDCDSSKVYCYFFALVYTFSG